VKLGDAGTKFFHANATLRHRRNLISELMGPNDTLVSHHPGKAAILWEDFKVRLGTSDFDQFWVDPSFFVQSDVDLSSLEIPLSPQEIDAVVKSLPNDKSPGPNGFNNEFLKKCWPIVKQDFYKFCGDFFDDNLCLKSINSSFITLIPKTDNARQSSDFRPISLLNSSIKIITKILANRLQQHIISLVHRNQYGFIKSRTIQDCLAWAFEYLHLCPHSRKEIVIIKLDFEKAFDKIEHQAMITIMRAMGFGQRWLKWMEAIFASGTSAIMLNGVPSRTIHCKRGVRQGYPLSPLLFVIAADFLQSMINKAMAMGQLRLPIPMSSENAFPIIQYVDDTLIVCEGDAKQLFFLKSLLNTFSMSTSLKVNFSKSMMVPINTSAKKLDLLAATFGCSKGALPFTYVGLPLCIILIDPNFRIFCPLLINVRED